MCGINRAWEVFKVCAHTAAMANLKKVCLGARKMSVVLESPISEPLTRQWTQMICHGFGAVVVGLRSPFLPPEFLIAQRIQPPCFRDSQRLLTRRITVDVHVRDSVFLESAGAINLVCAEIARLPCCRLLYEQISTTCKQVQTGR